MSTGIDGASLEYGNWSPGELEFPVYSYDRVPFCHLGVDLKSCLPEVGGFTEYGDRGMGSELECME